MVATKSNRVGVQIEKPLYDRIRKEAKRQDRKIRSVTSAVIAKGLEVVEREQQTAANVAGHGS
jgi:hypothetical protein